jgi:hypothetical protein
VRQGLDAAGKDSTIKHVMSGVSPQGVEVRSFKQPSAAELEHDFLWATRPRCPHGADRHRQPVSLRGGAGRPDGSGAAAAESLPEAAGKRDIWAQRYWDINRWEHTWPTTASRW